MSRFSQIRVIENQQCIIMAPKRRRRSSSGSVTAASGDSDSAAAPTANARSATTTRSTRSSSQKHTVPVIAVSAAAAAAADPLEAWLCLFRSGCGQPRSLGKVALLLSRSLSKVLKNHDEVWAGLCLSALGMSAYAALPQAMKTSPGGHKWLFEKLCVEKMTKRETIRPLDPPGIRSSDLTFLIKVWKGEEAVLSHAVSGTELDSTLFSSSYVPRWRHRWEEYPEWDFERDGYRESSCGDIFPGEVHVPLPTPIAIRDTLRFEECSVSVHLTRINKKGEPECIRLLEHPNKAIESGSLDDWDGERPNLIDNAYDGNYECEGMKLVGIWGNVVYAHKFNKTCLDMGRTGHAILGVLSVGVTTEASIL